MASSLYLEDNDFTFTPDPNDSNADCDDLGTDNSWIVFAEDSDDPVDDLTVDNDEANYVVIGGQADRNEFEDFVFNYFNDSSDESGGTTIFKNVTLIGNNYVYGSDVEDAQDFLTLGSGTRVGGGNTLDAYLYDGDDVVKVSNAQVNDSYLQLGDGADAVKIKGESLLGDTDIDLYDGSGGDNEDDLIKFKPGFNGSVNDLRVFDFEDDDELNLEGTVYTGDDLQSDTTGIAGYEYDSDKDRGLFTTGVYAGMELNFV